MLFAGGSAAAPRRSSPSKRTSTPMKGSAWRAAKVESGQDITLLQALVSILNDEKPKSLLDDFKPKSRVGGMKTFHKAASMIPIR